MLSHVSLGVPRRTSMHHIWVGSSFLDRLVDPVLHLRDGLSWVWIWIYQIGTCHDYEPTDNYRIYAYVNHDVIDSMSTSFAFALTVIWH